MYTKVEDHRLPSTVPRNVGPPPTNPVTARKRRLGHFESPVSGPAMPKPSVVLWAANPIIKINANPIAPDLRLTYGESFTEVVSANAYRNHH